MPADSTGTSHGTHHLIERQMLFHDALERAEKEPPEGRSGTRYRFVTVSRDVGTPGSEVATELGRHLGWHVFDREIVEAIAADTNVRQQLVSQLDEKSQNVVHETVERLLRLTEGRSFGVPEYHESLIKTLGFLAAHGRSIIVGRGANFALRGGEGLHIRVTASNEYRIERLSREWGTSLSETRSRLETADAEKREFIRQHFHGELGDPSCYDVIFSMDHLSTAQVTAVILSLVGLPPVAR